MRKKKTRASHAIATKVISKATPVQVSLQKSLLDESVASVPSVFKMQADKALKECNGMLCIRRLRWLLMMPRTRW